MTLKVHIKADKHSEDIKNLTNELGEKITGQETKAADLQKVTKELIDALKGQLNALGSESDTKVHPLYDSRFLTLTMRAKVNGHAKDIKELTKELERKIGAQEIKIGKLTALQQTAKTEVDALKGELNTLRAASKSKVCCLFSI